MASASHWGHGVGGGCCSQHGWRLWEGWELGRLDTSFGDFGEHVMGMQRWGQGDRGFRAGLGTPHELTPSLAKPRKPEMDKITLCKAEMTSLHVS